MSQSAAAATVSFQSMEPSARNRSDRPDSCSWVRFSPISRLSSSIRGMTFWMSRPTQEISSGRIIRTSRTTMAARLA